MLALMSDTSSSLKLVIITKICWSFCKYEVCFFKYYYKDVVCFPNTFTREMYFFHIYFGSIIKNVTCCTLINYKISSHRGN